MKNNYEEFLNAFFKIFSARIVEIKVVGLDILGVIHWYDEDEYQDIKLTKDFNEEEISLLIKTINFLTTRKLIHNDKIIKNEEEVINELEKSNWSNSDAERALSTLLKVQIFMVDNGSETDSFFLHF